MEPGRIEFIDHDGTPVPSERREDELDIQPAGKRHGRWPVLVLAAVIVVGCGGVLWHQHAGGAKHPSSAAVTPAGTVTVAGDPLSGDVLYGGVRPTGELLAEAERKQEQLQCMNQGQVDLMKMIAAYRSALGAGGSVREAERAARAALVDAPAGGVSVASYDVMFRVWRINRTALAKLSGERLNIDMTALCPG